MATILVVARVLFVVFADRILTGDPTGHDQVSKLTDAASRVGDLSAGNVSELIDLLLHTSLLVTTYVVAVFGIAIYLVLRPLSSGAIAFRTVLHGPLSGRRFYRRENRLAAQLRLGQREANVYGVIGLESARDPRVDIVAKACLVAPILLFAADQWNLFLRAQSSFEAGTAGTITYTTSARDNAYALVALGLGSRWCSVFHGCGPRLVHHGLDS